MRILLALLFFSLPAMAKINVVTTFSILKDMTHEVGGDKVNIKSLVGPNQDTHVYEPRPQDAKALGHADLVIVNGLGFEGWLSRLVEASGYKGRIVVATSGIVPLNNKGYDDPHAWHSLQNAQIYVDNIVLGLSKVSPKDAAFFKVRGEHYKKRLAQLEKTARQSLAAVPIQDRVVITPHDAFGYLGKEFGITFFSPLGISTDAEPSAKAIAQLIQRIRKDNIQAIFVENISNPRLLQQISQETNTHIGGILYSDALSPPGTGADSYLKMMSYNLSEIIKGVRKYK